MKKINIAIALLIVLLNVLIITSCGETGNKQIIIALSKGSGSEHYVQYSKWLASYDSTIIFVDLYHLSTKDSIKLMMSKADGLLLTGGPDVHPDRYGKGFDTSRCGIDAYRDTIEFMAIDIAMKRKLPILGICRGQQILNIYFGGTLFVDIPSDYSAVIRHSNDSTGYCFHNVNLIDGTRFKKIIKYDSIMVNSYHHQGIDKLSDKFIISSRSNDGLPESIEWKGDDRYIRAVQWHPEREENKRFTRPLGREFIDNCYKFRNFVF